MTEAFITADRKGSLPGGTTDGLMGRIPPENEVTRTAYHEAGHAVAAVLSGLKIGAVSIAPSFRFGDARRGYCIVKFQTGADLRTTPATSTRVPFTIALANQIVSNLPTHNSGRRIGTKQGFDGSGSR